MNKPEIFNSLFEVIKSRRHSDPQTSYVASLYEGGIEKINRKIMEEAFETTQASQSQDQEHLIKEICDLIFHTFVLAAKQGIEMDDLQDEFSRRFGVSGHDEKRNRK